MKRRAWLAGVAASLAARARAQVPEPTPTPRPGPPVITTLTMFAGTDGGLFRTRDWAGTWQPVALPGEDVLPPDASPVRLLRPYGLEVYAGGDRGLFHSGDFGETWQRLPLEENAFAVLTSRYAPADPTLFVATGAGLFRRDEPGRPFRRLPLDAAVYELEWPGPHLVLGTSRGVFVSVDGGESFGGPGEGLPPTHVRALVVSSFFAVDPVILAAAGDAGVFRSGDAGQTWASIGLEGRAVTDLFWLGPFLYACAHDGLYRTVDLGETWERLSERDLRDRSPSVMLFPLAPDSGAEFFIGSERGVYRTQDGGERFTHAGLSDRRILALGTFPPPPPDLDKDKKKGRK